MQLKKIDFVWGGRSKKPLCAPLTVNPGPFLTASGLPLGQLGHTQEQDPSQVMAAYSTSRDANRLPCPQPGQFGTDVDSIKTKT